ncbi:MAG: cobalamin-dependent protein [Archangium sp.]|nr:cobalamin-dependent protein [Archangium sp.]MDP3154330.1 cobalamin-dependent protein [Archangium sp.]MDP3574165.1 cobalamin-dependent protein [Archangium sp.]
MASPLSPVLLIGAGTGEATCGILYLASFLRRHGIEAFVRLTDADETDDEVARSLEGLIAHVRPKLVGISLKWFHHVARARLIAKTLRKVDPSVQIVVGGNTATSFCQDLLAWDCVDHVILGDGEVPLLALCRGDEAPPNVVNKNTPQRALSYIDGTAKADVYYSHFDDIFLSQLDRHSFSGWVAPGKGCGENCLYCGGTRGMQKATFGRAKPFLRPEESVRQDHREIVPRTWQLRYDFAGSTAKFLEATWEGVDLSQHSTTYFLWGVPPPELAETLSRHFKRAYMVLDIGCFSEQQRQETMKRGLLKPCPSDRELFEVIERCKQFPNLQLEISGIAGLPFASHFTLDQERKLVDRVLGQGCSIGYQRLEAQPGALVTEHPERFEMKTEARTFKEFLDYFEALEPGEKTVPMVRFLDDKLETAVQRTSDEVDATVWEAAAKKNDVAIEGRTRLINTSASTLQFELGAWLGPYRVPARVAKEPVTVVRSIDGAGLSCAPSVSRRRFSDPLLQQGEEGAALLDVLAAFERPTTVNTALTKLKTRDASEVIDHLVAGKFLQPA